jgi:hypothetical protein
MRMREVRKEIARIMEAIKELSSKVLIVVSIQDDKYKERVLPEFKKRINLGNEKHGRLTTAVNYVQSR